MCRVNMPLPPQERMMADILGFSLRFPESASPSEFWENLKHGVDMQTSDNRRWPVGYYNTPPRVGKAPDLEFFDNTFFSVHGKQAQRMDPQLRKLLEAGYEAWIDSGLDFTHLRGSSRVGVYVGACGSDAHGLWLTDIPSITGYEQTGCAGSMFANRLSWYFDFCGPSKVVDSACSSSLLALHDAVSDIAVGRVDYAMVGGGSAILSPPVSVAFNRLQMLSPEAACKSFDAAGNGYTRADGISVIILRRPDLHDIPVWALKTPLATILGIATNNDGYTKESITFPSSQAQTSLARKVLLESGVRPTEISYVEAHGTGTVAGDAQELNSIDTVYGSGDAGRSPSTPLLIGSVKSNMGHCEGGSGLASVIKMLLAFENGMLPGNLHYKEPNPNSESLKNGTIKVVTENTPFADGIVAINNFGFGGTNVHLVMKGSTRKDAILDDTGSDKQIIPLASRTSEGLSKLVDVLNSLPNGPWSFARELRHLANSLYSNVATHPVRGAIVPSGEATWKQAQGPNASPVWFAFSGNGSQWAGMARELLEEDRFFKDRILSCTQVLKEKYGFDILPQFTAENGWDDPVSASVALTAIQIAMVDLLIKNYVIKPAGVFGHSAGEIAAGYADGGLTLEQTMCVAYERASRALKSSSGQGLMAAVGMSAADATASLTKEGLTSVVVACDNGPKSVTLSGLASELRPFLEILRNQNVFVREVETWGVAYHSPALAEAVPGLTEALEKIIPEPKARSTSWISSTYPAGSTDEAAGLVSAQYQVNGFKNRVLFREACEQLPKDITVLEIGPHSILKSLIKQCRPDLAYVPTLKKGENSVQGIQNAVADLWKSGASIQWAAPALRQPGNPLPRALMEALVSWDHRTKIPLPNPLDRNSGAFSKTFDLSGADAHLIDHNVDGRIIIPATAYIVTAWEAFAVQKQKAPEEVPVVISDIQIFQAVQGEIDTPVTLSVLLDRSNRFQVVHSGDLIAEGKIKVAGQPKTGTVEKAEKGETDDKAEAEDVKSNATEESEPVTASWLADKTHTVDKEEFYRHVGRTGIHYGPNFQMVEKATSDGKCAVLRWDGCFIRFLDGCLQVTALGSEDYQLRIPTRIRQIAILDPKPALPKGSQVVVNIDSLCGSGTSELANVVGVELSLAPKKPQKVETKVTAVEWVPYGERVVYDPVRMKFHESLCGVVKHQLTPYLKKMEADGTIKPHLEKMLHMISNVDAPNPSEEVRQEAMQNPSWIMARILMDMLSTEEKFHKFLESPIQALMEHPEHDRLYVDDPIAGALSKPDLKVLVDIVLENTPPSGYTALEIGAGTGGLTRQIVPMLQASLHQSPLLKYIATDVTAGFGPNLKAAIQLPQFDFKVWDINEPGPEELAGKVNVVLASNAVHTCRDLATTLSHVHNLLADDGFFLFYEYTGILTCTLWGLSEECWKYTDEREYGLWITLDRWKRLLKAAGLSCVSIVRAPGDAGAYLLYRKMPRQQLPSELLPGPPLNGTDAEIDNWLEKYTSHSGESTKFQGSKASVFNQSDSPQGKISPRGKEQEQPSPAKLDSPRDDSNAPRLWLYGNLSSSPGLPGMIHTVRVEPGGTRVRTLLDIGRYAPMEPALMLERAEDLDLVSNVFREGMHGSYRTVPLKVEELGTEHSMDGGRHGSHLELTEYGNLASQVWVANPPPPPGFMEATVAYSALNFKDVMLAYGKLPRDAMGSAGKLFSIGLEFSGQLNYPAKLGDKELSPGQRIMGSAMNAVATKVAAVDYKVYPVPDSWSLAEAATVPIAYSTAYFALIMRGGLRKGQKVLIHSGTGAVGLAAIQICLHRDCEVFTTCSSSAKRSFLLETFPKLDDDHIGDSRSPSFEETVMRGTKGKGVDLCLNSLDQEKLQASIRCLAPFGSLLEIGKFDMVVGSVLPMRAMLRGVNFQAIHLEQILVEGPNVDTTLAWELHKIMLEGLESGEVQPLPFTIFSREQTEDAFRYLSKGVHIGKVMIGMNASLHSADAVNVLKPVKEEASPSIGEDEGQPQTKTAPLPLSIKPTWACRPGRSYIITGGLGGFGLALAEWLVSRGATHLVITSSRGIRTGGQRKVIDAMRALGVQVEVSLLNVSVQEQAAELLQLASEIAPIAGIFHLAMVLADRLLANQSGEGWNRCVLPKAMGAINLDAESRRLSTPLDVFVLFSSAIVEMGNPGQANYGYGNAVGDELCRTRLAEGVPGVSLSVQWGAVGDVGFLAQKDTEAVLAGLDPLQLQPQPIDDCLTTLGCMLAGGQFTPPVMGSHASMVEKERKKDADVKDLVGAILGIMGLSEANVGENDDLSQMGIDSMQVVEVRSTLQRALGRPFPLEEIGQLTLAKLKALAAEAGLAPDGAEPTPASDNSQEGPVSETCKSGDQEASEVTKDTEAAADELDALLGADED